MPVDALGDAIGAAVEIVGEAILDIPDPPKHGRLRRIIYWSVVALFGGVLSFVIYVALS